MQIADLRLGNIGRLPLKTRRKILKRKGAQRKCGAKSANKSLREMPIAIFEIVDRGTGSGAICEVRTEAIRGETWDVIYRGRI
jgi:hypothetical protein